MKNILIIVTIILGIMSCKAQHIIPLEEVLDYRELEGGLMGDRDYVYVKDINNLLSKYVGIWKGVYNTKNYEFSISKTTTDDGELKEDLLLMRYKITDLNGVTFEDTTSLSNDNVYTRGQYLDRNNSPYVFYYQGENSECGQNGNIFVSVYGINNTIMQLFLQVVGETIGCTTGPAEQVIPTTSMELIKQ